MQTNFNISPRSVFRGQLMIIGGLLLMHIAVMIIAYGFGHMRAFGLRRLFDVGGEQNVPAFYSALALLACGLAALLNRSVETSRRSASAWLLIAAGFAFLSFDEACSFHEQINKDAPALGLSGPFLYVWVIPYGLLTLAALAIMLPFVRTLPSRVRNILLAGGAIYVASALGMEMVEGVLTTQLGRDVFEHGLMRMYLALEEGGEMLGVAIMLRGLLENLAGRDAIALTVTPTAAPKLVAQPEGA